MTAVSSAIRLHNLTAAYRGHPAVHHLSGDLVAGAMTTAVVGPNGAGESSLLGALGAPCAAMKVASKKSTALRIAYLPQASALDRGFPVRVFDALSAIGLSDFGQRLLLLRPREVSSRIAPSAILEVANDALRSLLKHRHVLVGGGA